MVLMPSAIMSLSERRQFSMKVNRLEDSVVGYVSLHSVGVAILITIVVIFFTQALADQFDGTRHDDKYLL